MHILHIWGMHSRQAAIGEGESDSNNANGGEV